METNLKHIAQGRTHIFGAAVVETFIGQRIGEEDVNNLRKSRGPDTLRRSVRLRNVVRKSNLPGVRVSKCRDPR